MNTSNAYEKNVSPTPTTAAAVANEFLKLGELESIPIDPMKLQKLVYYAHAWFLAYKNMPLFDDDVEAWPWGPVIQSIYGDFKDFRGQPITGKKATVLHKTKETNLNFEFSTPFLTDKDKQIKDFIKSVWDSHKKFSGIQLSNATHMPNEPWTIVKDKYGSLDSKPRIDNEIIKEIFKAKLKKVV